MKDKKSTYMAIGMCFGAAAGSIAMSFAAMFGQLVFGMFFIPVGLALGTLGGLVFANFKNK